MAPGTGTPDARIHGRRFGAFCDTCGSEWRNVAIGARKGSERRDAVGDEGRGASERTPVGIDRRQGERQGPVSESTHFGLFFVRQSNGPSCTRRRCVGSSCMFRGEFCCTDPRGVRRQRWHVHWHPKHMHHSGHCRRPRWYRRMWVSRR